MSDLTPPLVRAKAERFVRRNVHLSLVDHLGGMIVSGQIAPGERLAKEPQMMLELGISRTTVREAIKVLSAKGLVESRQNVGSTVRARRYWNLLDPDVVSWITSRDAAPEILSDIRELRRAFEPSVARLAATKASPEDVAVLRQHAECMINHFEDIERYNDADVQFHVRMFESTENAMMIQIGHLIERFLSYTLRVQHEISIDLVECARRHLEVVEAIEAGNGDLAEERMAVVLSIGESEVGALIAAQ